MEGRETDIIRVGKRVSIYVRTFTTGDAPRWMDLGVHIRRGVSRSAKGCPYTEVHYRKRERGVRLLQPSSNRAPLIKHGVKYGGEITDVASQKRNG